MKHISSNELNAILTSRKNKERLSLDHLIFEDMDLRKKDFHNCDLSFSTFQNVILDESDLSDSSLENVLLDDCSLYKVSFENSILRGCSMRRCDMRYANLNGADLFSAILEKADLQNVITNESTKWFRLHCPETGAFIGYKKCLYNRIVTLLIPADAMRTSATLPTCRCSKAKVLKITNFDESEHYKDAWSTVDSDFCYRLGKWVEVKDFNEDRWMDSTTGIHFWMDRNEALSY